MPRVVAAVSALSSNADTAYWVVSGEMLGLVLLFQAFFFLRKRESCDALFTVNLSLRFTARQAEDTTQ